VLCVPSIGMVVPYLVENQGNSSLMIKSFYTDSLGKVTVKLKMLKKLYLDGGVMLNRGVPK
jgi:hypothetical protein